MKISFEHEEVPSEFKREILAICSKYSKLASIETEEISEWTFRRVDHLMKLLPADVRYLIADLVRQGGWIEASALRAEGRDLRATTLSITRAVQRGIKEEAWPASIEPPITLVFEPSPSGRKARGYAMDHEVISVLREVCQDLEMNRSAGPHQS